MRRETVTDIALTSIQNSNREPAVNDQQHQSTEERSGSYDVVVIGGGAAGIGAAVGAARTGARTLLVERYGFLGGASTISQVATYCGFYTRGDAPDRAVAGVGQLVLDQLKSLGVPTEPFQVPSTGNWVVLLDPEATKIAAERTVLAAGVDLLLHARLVDVQHSNGVIESVTLFDHEGYFTCSATSFVDASGDANLAYLAGASVQAGDGQGNYQVATLALQIGGVSHSAALDADAFIRAVERYNKDHTDPLPPSKPLMVRLPLSGRILMLVVDEELSGISAQDLTEAEISARRQAWGYAQAIQEGMMGFEGSHLATTGPQIGIRESRHTVGVSSVTGKDLLAAQRRKDAVARAAWPVELHPRAGESTYAYIANNSWADIPYDALRSIDRKNLWCAGRTISCDTEAYGSLRVMGTAFATGHAAGVGAAAWAETRTHDVELVRRLLDAQGALV